jgi:hypothetical protein
MALKSQWSVPEVLFETAMKADGKLPLNSLGPQASPATKARSDSGRVFGVGERREARADSADP